MSYDYNESTKDSINTTDIVRFFHREIGGYLTVTKRDVESNLPEYPDFLKKEIAILAEEKDDLEEDEEEDVIIDEGKVEQEILIYIEKDSSKLDRTNTLWEIQRIETFVGGNLTTNEKYLIRHVATGMYLSASDHIELSLTKDGNALENEFTFKNDTLQELIKSPIPDKSLICIQNLDEKYIQTYTDAIKEDFNYSKSQSFSFINQWAIIKEEEDGEIYDKYDEILATTTEEELQEKTNEIIAVLDLVIQDLNGHTREELAKIQTFYAEQGILHILLKLAELNFYKCTKLKQRAADLLGKAQFRLQAIHGMGGDNIDDEEISAERIAEEYLVSLNDKILRVIYLLIKYNPENCNVITQYDQLVYKIKEIVEIEEYELKFKPRISKILVEAYKRCTHIHNDKAAVMIIDGQLDYEAITSRLVAGISANADKKLSNQIDKWLEMVDHIYYIDEKQSNIIQQTLYAKVIAMF